MIGRREGRCEGRAIGRRIINKGEESEWCASNWAIGPTILRETGGGGRMLSTVASERASAIVRAVPNVCLRFLSARLPQASVRHPPRPRKVSASHTGRDGEGGHVPPPHRRLATILPRVAENTVW
jgi:hypothetical protein